MSLTIHNSKQYDKILIIIFFIPNFSHGSLEQAVYYNPILRWIVMGSPAVMWEISYQFNKCYNITLLFFWQEGTKSSEVVEFKMKEWMYEYNFCPVDFVLFSLNSSQRQT